IIERERSIKGEQRRRAINVIRSLSFMVVAFPIYLYHWKLIKRENSLRENSANPQGPGTPV
ncbi:MAG: hypothetical protein HYY09_02940, partial [Firmicutes bacterium]|nr:hypothetical protein [Bacillota bacterium]